MVKVQEKEKTKLELLLEDPELRGDSGMLSSAIVSLTHWGFNPENLSRETLLEVTSLFLEAKNYRGLGRVFAESNGQLPELGEMYLRTLSAEDIDLIASHLFDRQHDLPKKATDFLKLAPDVLAKNEKVIKLIGEAGTLDALECAIVFNDANLVAETFVDILTRYISDKPELYRTIVRNEYKTESALREKMDSMVPQSLSTEVFKRVSAELMKLNRPRKYWNEEPKTMHQEAAEYAVKSGCYFTITGLIEKMSEKKDVGAYFVLAEHLYKNKKIGRADVYLRRVFNKENYAGDHMNKKFMVQAAELLGDFNSLKEFFLADLAENVLFYYQTEAANEVFKVLSSKGLVKTSDVVESIENLLKNKKNEHNIVCNVLYTLNKIVPENRKINRNILRAAIQSALEAGIKDDVTAGLEYMQKCGPLSESEKKIKELIKTSSGLSGVY